MHRGARGGRKPSPGFLRSAARMDTSSVSQSLLKQARKSGQLNLSNRSLEVVPVSVWHINTDPPPDQNSSFSAEGDDKWWDQVNLFKLILAANQIKDIPDDIQLLSALTVLDIHSNKLSGLPEVIGELQQLKRLVLSHNELSSLPSSLTSLTDLVSLKLDYNNLNALPEDIGLLVHIEDLDVSHNHLSRLPPSLGELASLHVLTATDNSLDNIPNELGSLKALKQLSLTNNKLSVLPDFSGAASLQLLYCNYNAISELPLFQCGSGIKELHMGFNKINRVDTERLTGLSSLIYLDLRDNKIRSIPESIVEVTTLERLDLTNNDLPSLPYVMGNMINLKSLLLEGNLIKGLRRDIVQKGTVEILKYLRSRIQIDDYPEPVHHSTKFTPTKQKSNAQAPQKEASAKSEKGGMVFSLDSKTIDITKKELTDLPQELYSMVQLTTLNAGHNKLTSLPPEIAVFTALTVLDIRNNHISELPQELERCTKLSDVVLSFNRFQKIPSVVYKLKSIENILANDNQINVIDVDGLLQLPMVSCLNLQNNNISQVPPHLGTVTTLKHLQLGGNSFRIPRATILAKGTAAILDYLKDRIPT